MGDPFSSLLTSDDSYVWAWANSCLIVPGIFLCLLIEEFPLFDLRKHHVMIFYPVIIVAPLTLAAFSGGEGSGIAALFIPYFVIGYFIALAVLRFLSRRSVIAALWCFAALYVIGYIAAETTRRSNYSSITTSYDPAQRNT